MKFIDIHSHILPSFDDGAFTAQSAVEMLKKSKSFELTDIFVTPHFSVRRGFVKEREQIEKQFSEFSAYCDSAGVDVRLHIGCEIEYSEDVPQLLSKKRLPSLAGSKYILLEFPPFVSYNEIKKGICAIISSGFAPVIAHVERYPAIRENIYHLDELKRAGAYIQLNIFSAQRTPLFGKSVPKQIYSEHLVDFIGGDMHKTPDYNAEIFFKRIGKWVADDRYFDKITYKNALDIIQSGGH